MVRVQLASAGAATEREALEAAGLVRSIAEPHCRLEHVYAQPSPTGLQMVLFLIAPGLEC